MVRAQIGDWILVQARTGSGAERRGQIVGVHGATGEPPFDVHWVDTDRTSLVFPGPDAQVLTTRALEVIDRREEGRIGAVQSEILASGRGIARAPRQSASGIRLR